AAPGRLRSSRRLRRPPRSTPFPYTTLFRSMGRLAQFQGLVAEHVRPFGRRRGGDLCRFMDETPEPLGETPGALHAFLGPVDVARSEEHTSELQSRENLVCRLLREKKNRTYI